MNEAQTIANDQLAGSTDYLSVAQLAEMLKLNPATIRLWVREQRLPVRKDGRRYLILGNDVARLLAATPSLGNAHHHTAATRRELEKELDVSPRRQETGHRALATGLLQRGLS